MAINSAQQPNASVVVRGPTWLKAEGARARRRLSRKAPELLDNNMTTMHTIPTDSGFANKPSDVSTFTIERSLGIPAPAGAVADDIGRLRRAT